MTNENEIMQNTCEECGCVDEELFELDGKLLCSDCAEAAGFKRCDICGEWIREEDGYVTVNGDFICDDCYCDGFATCEDCGEIVSADDMTLVNEGSRSERFVCSCCIDSYTRCDDCGGYFSDELLYSDCYGNAVCNDCFDRRWYFCEDCDRLISSDEATWVNDEGPFCEGCAEDHRDSGSFHDYGYKPDPEFQLRSSELSKLAGEQGRVVSSYEAQDFVPTFGVELEVDCGDDHNDLADELEELDEPIYMKHDGSLGDEGVEIVTHPCSLAFHMYELRWAEISRVCESHGFKSHDTTTCGLHIHVGRRCLGSDSYERKTTAAKLVWLTVRFQNELTAFSRRKAEQLERWASFPRLDYEDHCHDELSLREAALQTEWAGRYQAINLCPSETVEFRFFRGTLKRSTIIASIQLISNMVKYAMTHTLEECADKAEWTDIINAEQFKELSTYAAKRGLL